MRLCFQCICEYVITKTLLLFGVSSFLAWKFWPFWIIDAATCWSFSLAHCLKFGICQPRIFCICTCRLDCICAVVWVVFVPASEPSICRMSVRRGDVRAGADLASRPRATLQCHVLRTLRVRPGEWVKTTSPRSGCRTNQIKVKFKGDGADLVDITPMEGKGERSHR